MRWWFLKISCGYGDKEWKPVGKYLLGLWHSHPAGITRPSIGDPAANEGDIVYFRSLLENDDSPNGNWNVMLCPITTFDKEGNDLVNGWILRRGETNPEPRHVIIDPFCSPCLDAYLDSVIAEEYGKGAI